MVGTTVVTLPKTNIAPENNSSPSLDLEQQTADPLMNIHFFLVFNRFCSVEASHLRIQIPRNTEVLPEYLDHAVDHVLCYLGVCQR